MPSLGDVLPWERVGWHAHVEGAQVRLSGRVEGLCLDLPGWEGHRGNGLRHRVTTWGREGEQGLGTSVVRPQPPSAPCPPGWMDLCRAGCAWKGTPWASPR